MVAAWGGYVFIINIIPIYTVVMVVAGRYSSRLYIAYSTFYALGSIMAMQVSAFACLLSKRNSESKVVVTRTGTRRLREEPWVDASG